MRPSIQYDRVRNFRERSYFVVPAFENPIVLARLRSACDRVLKRVRAESSTQGHTSPSVSLLAHHGHFAAEPAALDCLLTYVASAGVCRLLEGLASEEEARTPRLIKTDYYHEQTRHDWDGDWHRDSQFKERDPGRERALVLGTTAV